MVPAGNQRQPVVALEFPAFTCGMPSNSVVFRARCPFPRWPRGSGLLASGHPAQFPRAACFDAMETSSTWTVTDSPTAGRRAGAASISTATGRSTSSSAYQVNTNGDGVTLTTECADPTHKDLFVEIDYMQNHKPDPKALSQTQSPATLVNNVPVGVKSVREAFAAAPVARTPTPRPASDFTSRSTSR